MTPRSSLGVVAVAVALLHGCNRSSPAAAPPSPSAAATSSPSPASTGDPKDEEINPRLLRRFQPVDGASASPAPANPERVALGRALFYETRLSKDHQISCNSCHALTKFGIDGK